MVQHMVQLPNIRCHARRFRFCGLGCAHPRPTWVCGCGQAPTAKIITRAALFFGVYLRFARVRPRVRLATIVRRLGVLCLQWPRDGLAGVLEPGDAHVHRWRQHRLVVTIMARTNRHMPFLRFAWWSRREKGKGHATWGEGSVASLHQHPCDWLRVTPTHLCVPACDPHPPTCAHRAAHTTQVLAREGEQRQQRLPRRKAGQATRITVKH